MSRLLKIALALNLIALTLLTLAFPHLMVAPGKLIPGHASLETDCFACHSPWLGAANARCTSCHRAEDIGLRDTQGKPLLKPLTKVAFHQKLQKTDCMACHSDHAGARRYRVQGSFNHALLQREAQAQCQSCHQTPRDKLHLPVKDQCSQCHSVQGWVPAQFDHERHFAFDRDHRVACATCHVGNDYGRYTCYGCHEHTPEKIRRKHIKEGIRDFKDCAQCHRNADEHDIRMPGRGQERGAGRRTGDEDD